MIYLRAYVTANDFKSTLVPTIIQKVTTDEKQVQKGECKNQIDKVNSVLNIFKNS